MLRIDHLQIAPLPALSFEVRSGHCLAVEGPSGSGKTRLLRAIADLDPAHGDIFLDGAHRDEMSGPDWRRSVRHVSAEPGWWTKTPRETLLRATPQHTVDDTKLRQMMNTVGLDAGLLDDPITTLSTGQRQRLALLRALADKPRVILLDEPTAALDPTSAALVEELIRFQLLAGKIVLLVSHDAKLRARLQTQQLDIVNPGPNQFAKPETKGATLEAGNPLGSQ